MIGSLCNLLFSHTPVEKFSLSLFWIGHYKMKHKFGQILKSIKYIRINLPDIRIDSGRLEILLMSEMATWRRYLVQNL